MLFIINFMYKTSSMLLIVQQSKVMQASFLKYTVQFVLDEK